MRKIFYVILFFFPLELIFSHPHLFIKPDIKIEATEDTISGIQITWEWDKWWSADVIAGCDFNGNGVFESKEVTSIYTDFFSGIKDFGYFTVITINGRRYKIKSVEKFTAYSKNGIVTYSFFVPILIPRSGNDKLSIVFNDETVYTAFDTKNASIKNTPEEIQNTILKGFSYYGIEIAFDLIKPVMN